MKKTFLLLLLVGFCSSGLAAETAEQLQKRLLAAQLEIESLKEKIAAMQSQVQQARDQKILPPARPLQEVLGVEHPIITAYELASYAETDQEVVKSLLKGKVVSVSGSVGRFQEGLGRGFKVFLDTSGAAVQVGGSFNSNSTTKSVYTKEDGAELVIDDERRGPNTFAALKDNVVMSGFFKSVSKRQISLSDCILQKQ